LRTSKFRSVYHTCAPFEGCIHMVVWKSKILVCHFRKFLSYTV
jgi:hypothetical protein